MIINYEMYRDMQKRFDEYVKDNNKDPEKIFTPNRDSFIWTNDLIVLSKLDIKEFPVEYSNSNNPNLIVPPALINDIERLQKRFGS